MTIIEGSYSLHHRLPLSLPQSVYFSVPPMVSELISASGVSPKGVWCAAVSGQCALVLDGEVIAWAFVLGHYAQRAFWWVIVYCEALSF